MIAPYRSVRDLDSATNYLSMRRASSVVPLSSLIFPRSAADRYESNKLTRAMEEKFGFHYFTNTFCLDALVELDFQAYYTETNILPACYASIVSWALWLALCSQDVAAMFSSDADERFIAEIHLLISIIVLVPVPILVLCCRLDRFRGYEQIFLCAIVHCFAIAIMAGGAIAMIKDYRSFLLKDMEQLLNTLVASSEDTAAQSNTTDASAIASTHVYLLDDKVSWWSYESVRGTARALIIKYLDNGTMDASACVDPSSLMHHANLMRVCVCVSGKQLFCPSLT